MAPLDLVGPLDTAYAGFLNMNPPHRDMALRAAGRSARSLQAIRDMIENARTLEGIPATGRRPAPRQDT